MKIIIAPDSFKGSLTAIEAAQAMNKGIKKAFSDAETVLLPVADGGEGSMETLVSATNGKIEHVQVVGPLGSKVEAAYGILGDSETCVIEMATASGLNLVPDEQLSPLRATTYGTGQLIKQALDDGFSSFIIGIGGSATNDGGAGMLQALGLQILDKNGNEIGYGGCELSKINQIDMRSFDKRIKDCNFIIASDVQNPLIGANGASAIFGPQKGATAEDVALLDGNLTHWADEVAEITDIKLHDLPGAGAAGGIGGAFQAFFPFVMKRGIDVVLDYIKLDEKVMGADLIITGEGQVDSQTASGKTPMGVAQAAKRRDVPTIIIAGAVGKGIEVLYDFGVISANSIINSPMPLEEAIERAAELVELSAEQVVRSYFYQKINGSGRVNT
ncbi:glycerate kinase [Virgibacillus natechei]|uniref:Glycerate kinase n=1 Tax=Virgibacillus natechei TaxID=1216297 RepID=A0ABS4IJV1_9BACI|nr:glycerate kinase [Virgibacillus natechei]MBP1971245.1 glycerate kinase [Virgibacillus natechei]UZD12124.1 glycerate kinase [Virgibacillus natechei]